MTVTSPTATASALYRLTGSVKAEYGIKTLTVALNGGPAHDVSVPSGLTYSDDLTLREGLNTVVVTATDVTGLVGSITVTVTYTPPDIEPPHVSLRADRMGPLTTSAPLTLTADATDNRTVRDVTFVLDGVTYNPLATDSAAPYTVTVRPFTLVNGMHTVTATATDTSGLTASTQLSFTVDIERVSPAVTITSANVLVDGQGYVLTGTATDASGVVAIHVRPSEGGAALTGLTRQGDTFSVPITLPMGVSQYTVTAEDAMGNVTNLDTALNVIGPDISAPSQKPVWVPDETVAYTNPFAVVARASDDRAVVRAQLVIDGHVRETRDLTPPTLDCPAPLMGGIHCVRPFPSTPPEIRVDFTLAFQASENGPHVVQTRFTDKAGNVSTSPPLTLQVTIDPVQPQRPVSSTAGGRIFQWSPGSASVLRELISDPASPYLKTLAEVTIGWNERFALPLPTPTVMTPLLTPIGDVLGTSCTGDVTVSDPQARLSGTLQFQPVESRTSGVVLTGRSTDGLERQGGYVYADRPVTLNGTRTCPSYLNRTDVTTFDVSLPAGWSLLVTDTLPTTRLPERLEQRLSVDTTDGLYWTYR